MIAQNGINGAPDKDLSLKTLLQRRDELESAPISEETAWAYMRLAADFDALKFYANAERCRNKGTHYFGFENPDPPEPQLLDWQTRKDLE